MAVLLARGFAVLTMDQFVAWLLRQQPVPSPAALLTFDGGYRSQLDNALPVLETFGWSATFFPMSAGLDEAEISGGELAALAARGHMIGFHTHTHPDLTALSPEDLEREVGESKRVLEDVIGRPVTAFCYPEGLRSPRVAAAVRDAGFEVAFTIDLGDVPSRGEPGPRELDLFLNGTRLIAGGILIGWKLRERWLDRLERRDQAPRQAAITASHSGAPQRCAEMDGAPNAGSSINAPSGWPGKRVSTVTQMRSASGETPMPFRRSGPSAPMPGSVTRPTAITVPSCLIRATVPLPRFTTYRSEPRASDVLLEKTGLATSGTAGAISTGRSSTVDVNRRGFSIRKIGPSTASGRTAMEFATGSVT
jgi:peptidoglycan/xylan/chitin deacetylase (PgdA/CDA1 family)